MKSSLRVENPNKEKCRGNFTKAKEKGHTHTHTEEKKTKSAQSGLLVLCALFSFVFAFTLTFHTCYVRIYPNETTWSNKKQQKCHNKKTDKTRKYYLEQLDSWHIYSAL